MWKLVALMFLAMSMIPAGDTAGKILTSEYGASPLFVAWSRFVLGSLIAVPLLRADTLRILRDWRIWLRALLLTCGIVSIQTALVAAPVADVFAAFFVGPIVSYALSILLLGERGSPQRSALMVLGFLGVLLVVRPGFDANAGLGFAVLAGVFYGAYLSASRWLAPLARPGSLLFSQLFISALLLTPFCWSSTTADLLLQQSPSGPFATLTLASAMFSMGGNFLLLFAYARAPAAQLAPYVYFQLLGAVALGWAVFGDLPDALTWLGLGLIVSAGLASATLSRRALRGASPPA